MHKILVLLILLIGGCSDKFVTELKGHAGDATQWELSTQKIYDASQDCLHKQEITPTIDFNACVISAVSNDPKSKTIIHERLARMKNGEKSKEDILCEKYWFLGSLEYNDCIEIAKDNL